MTFNEKYKLTPGWRNKCLIISLFHQRKKAQLNSKWTIEETAHYFKLSPAFICGSLKIVRCMDMLPEDIKTRASALRKIKGL